jgi:hypothetical protein
VRYELTEPPTHADYCHCRMCRRATGAPVSAGVSFRRAGFRLTKGQPRRYRSSECAFRHFCGDCGSPLFFESLDAPDDWEVLVGSLDDPAWVEMKTHSFTGSRIPWFDVRDDLPRSPAWRDPERHADRPQGY